MSSSSNILIDLNEISNAASYHTSNLINGVILGISLFALALTIVALRNGKATIQVGIVQAVEADPGEQVRPTTRKILRGLALVLVITSTISGAILYSNHIAVDNSANRELTQVLAEEGLTANEDQAKFLLLKYSGRESSYIQPETIGLIDEQGNTVNYVYKYTGETGVMELVKTAK